MFPDTPPEITVHEKKHTTIVVVTAVLTLVIIGLVGVYGVLTMQQDTISETPPVAHNTSPTVEEEVEKTINNTKPPTNDELQLQLEELNTLTEQVDPLTGEMIVFTPLTKAELQTQLEELESSSKEPDIEEIAPSIEIEET